MTSSLLRSAVIAMLAALLMQCGSKGPELGKAEAPPLPDTTWRKFTSIDELYWLHFPRGWHLEEEENDRECIGLAANRGEVFVLVSAADVTALWAERRPVLEKVLGSLVLHDTP